MFFVVFKVKNKTCMVVIGFFSNGQVKLPCSLLEEFGNQKSFDTPSLFLIFATKIRNKSYSMHMTFPPNFRNKNLKNRSATRPIFID